MVCAEVRCRWWMSDGEENRKTGKRGRPPASAVSPIFGGTARVLVPSGLAQNGGARSPIPEIKQVSAVCLNCINFP